MKHIVTILCSLFCIFQSSATDYVALSEVLFNTPLNEDTTQSPHNFGEFIEIYNAHDEPVSLNGWKLQTLYPEQTFNFPDIQLAGKSFLIVAYGDFDIHENMYDCFVRYYITKDSLNILFHSDLILPNDSCRLVLKDHNNITRDSVFFNSAYLMNGNIRDCNIFGNDCDFRSLQRDYINFNCDGTVQDALGWWFHDGGNYDENAPDKVTAGYSYAPINTNILPSTTSISTENYIVEVTPLTEQSDVSSLDWEDGIENALVNVKYYDVLGREKQSTLLKYTPDNKHLTTFTEYDEFNRVTKQWLPMVTEGGQFSINNIINIAEQYYSDSRPYKENLYSTTTIDSNDVYYNSLIGVQEPGVDLNGKYKKNNRRANNANEVKYFSVNSSNSLICNGYYSAKTLIYEEVKDEDNIVIGVYKDRNDRIVLKRKAGNVDTYFVYNNLGQLAYVIPPILADQLGDGTYSIGDTSIDNFAYFYIYDNRGNNILKKLPGAEPIIMLYDKANRLTVQQSGNQRENNLYTALKYDKWGRLAYSTENILPSSINLLNYKNQVAQEYFTEECFTEYAENYNLTTTEYSRTLDETLDLKNILRVIYYDSYEFLDYSSDLIYNANLNINTLPKANNAKGRITGEQIYLLGSNSEYITKAYYYDERGNIIQQHSTSYSGGVDKQYISYNFSGNIIRQINTKTAYGLSHSEQYLYTYDHANRLLNTQYRYNNGTPILLNQFTYDDLGRIKKKNIWNNADFVNYNYNIRSQITKIQSKQFRENIYYSTYDSLQSNWQTPRYNGSVSAVNYSYGSATNGYAYFYDNQNRLSSNYTLINGQSGDYDYSESFQYDKNGNIRSLTRWDNQDIMDYLSFEYEGNQIIGVSDNGYPPYSYDSKQYYDYANTDVEFAYDANGNMIYDLDRNICAIKYNLLNLPDTIQFANGNLIVHQYDALGNKYSTTYYTRNTPIVVPVGNVVEQLGSAYNKHHYVYNDNVTYRQLTNTLWRIERIENVEGYIGYNIQRNSYLPYYYIKDYLGNVRETYMGLTNTTFQCVQQMQYYPSGLPWNDNYQPSQQPYKYSGKEFVEMHGLDEYDSEARWYYPALMRTTTQDPLAEKYYDISPYAWCANNPVNLVDPDGRHISVTDNGDSTYTIVNGVLDNDKNIYIVNDKYDSNKEKILGQMLTKYSFFDDENKFVDGAVINMNDNAGDDFIKDFITNTPSIVTYIFDEENTGRNGGRYDFKAWGTKHMKEQQKNTHYYRGYNVFLGAKRYIASARDIGNFAAGYISGVNNIPLIFTKLAFTIYGGEIEPPVSQWPQNFGYYYGYYEFIKYYIYYGNKIY